MMNLFIGNIPFTATEEDLRELFSTVGEVGTITLPLEQGTGRKRGFGFVTVEDDAVAQQIIATFHEQEFSGRRLIVNEARPREERRDSRPPMGGGRPQHRDNRDSRGSYTV